MVGMRIKPQNATPRFICSFCYIMLIYSLYYFYICYSLLAKIPFWFSSLSLPSKVHIPQKVCYILSALCLKAFITILQVTRIHTIYVYINLPMLSSVLKQYNHKMVSWTHYSLIPPFYTPLFSLTFRGTVTIIIMTLQYQPQPTIFCSHSILWIPKIVYIFLLLICSNVLILLNHHSFLSIRNPTPEYFIIGVRHS